MSTPPPAPGTEKPTPDTYCAPPTATRGKVKHKTVANLSECSDGEIAAIKLALKHKDNLAALASIEEIETTLGKRIGAVWLLRVLAERLGIT